MRPVLLLSALLLTVPAAQTAAAQTTVTQTTGERLLSGTTFGLRWGIYAGGLTNLQDGEPRLRLSAPLGARVLGTRYDDQGNAALLAYRHSGNSRAALDFAVDQLQRQGFAVTFRAFPSPYQARALLRRVDLLLEVEVTRGARGVINVLYDFQQAELPERLLEDQVPEGLFVYAEPIDLRTVRIEPGKVFLTPPADALFDLASYQNGVVSLVFYGNFTLERLLDFYLPFFKAQGFIETRDVSEGELQRTFFLVRAGERVTLKVEAGPTTDRSRITMTYTR